MTSKSPSLASEIALRIRELRTERGWSQAQLASEMAALGFAWTRMTVTEVEGPRQRAVSIAEVLALAHVFDLGVTKILGLNRRWPPTHADANLLEVTAVWRPDRRDIASLIDTGRRSSAKEQALSARQAALLEEARRLDADRTEISRRLSEVTEALAQVRNELASAQREELEET